MQYQKEYHSPLGEMLLAADDEGLVGIWFQGAVHFGCLLYTSDAADE